MLKFKSCVKCRKKVLKVGVYITDFREIENLSVASLQYSDKIFAVNINLIFVGAYSGGPCACPHSPLGSEKFFLLIFNVKNMLKFGFFVRNFNGEKNYAKS